MEEPFLLKCNYELKDLTSSLSGFYSDLLFWWEEFKNTFSDFNPAQSHIKKSADQYHVTISRAQV